MAGTGEKDVKGFKTAPSDENELHMIDWTSHYNDKLNLDSALNVRVVTTVPASPAKVNGGVVNDVRIK